MKMILLSLFLPAVVFCNEKTEKTENFYGIAIHCLTEKGLPYLEDPEFIEATDPRGSTPLMNAVLYGCTDLAKALLAKNANVHHRNLQNSTAMIYAMKAGNFAVIKMLEAKGAAVLDKSNGATSLINAAESGNFALVKWLVEEKNANVNESLTQSQVYWPISIAAKSGHSAIIEFLITHGASQESIDAALFDAIELGHVDAVEALIDGGANLNRQDPVSGHTPLTMTAKYSSVWNSQSSYPEILRSLILAGADLKMKNKSGRTVSEMVLLDERMGGYIKDALKSKK